MFKIAQIAALVTSITCFGSPAFSQSSSAVSSLAEARQLQQQAENLVLFQLLTAAAVDVGVLYQSQSSYRDLSNKLILSPSGRRLITEWGARFSPARLDGRDGFKIEIQLNKRGCSDLMRTGIGITPGPVSAAAVNGKKRVTYWEKLCTRFVRKNIIELIAF
ncbi:hypothetical protein GOB19_23365 [Sinorhizobium meliloti]|nr:hypothetical protein [Sinorhizobium meliloti]MDX0307835.1 hypothetical protein [Sinorhizobium meliloti]MDX0376895.1 hypothetical protein [Sinorhizobium meliloti]